ncbi:DNA polymerase III subunit delta [Roseitranquillus sediminis]|uniref:DNA polymerase III subunit delta n=1 Tax=Roseitranquillus sediminis TaxID=2809051 RepID=UPI001D0C9C55|nr:DNA polymerase III subunit delta [Roseitranquillus sediminis]MBM9596268.1 DNA polymerase III subunit delta [Roseitranquillus sediminis]
MKLGARDAAAFFAKPDSACPAVLLYGGDAMRVALRRKDLIDALIGPEGEAEMRLIRLAPSDLRDEPSRLADEVRARGFYPGPRVVHLEGAADAQAKAVSAALEDWREGDAQLVVTAGSLTARSTLRRAIETHPLAAAIGIYDDPPGRDEIERVLQTAGIDTGRDREALDALNELGRSLNPGDFRQTVEKVALYKLGDPAPLTAADVAACAPATAEAAVDDIVDAAAGAEVERIGPLMRRLEAQGTAPVTLCIAASRHFRMLLAAAADPAGPAAALGRMRPPVFGPRRDRMRRQAQDWGAARLDAALQILVDTDLALRSSARAPQMAVLERALIRLAMMARR